MSEQKIKFSELTDAELSKMVSEAFGVKPHIRCKYCGPNGPHSQRESVCADHPTANFVIFPPFATSVDECLKLARENQIQLRMTSTYYADSKEPVFQVSLPFKDSRSILHRDPARAICLALLRFQGKEVE